jgi:tetratricopeptide (TPR) repeat protein
MNQGFRFGPGRRGIVLVLATALACAGAWAWPRWYRRWETFERSQVAYAQGDFAGAERQALRALKERPKDPRALRLVARAAARQGRHSLALEIFDQLGPNAIEAEDFALVGLCLLTQGRGGVARTSFERALELNSRQPEALDALADLDTQADRLAEATERARILATIPRWEGRGEVRLGRLLARQSDLEGAIAALGRALRRGSPPGTRPAIEKDLARALLALGRANEARDRLEDLRAQGDPEVAWLLSRANLATGDIKLALGALQEAGSYGRERIDEPEPAPYVGEARCAECHREIHRLARGSRHAKTYWSADRLDSFPLPDHTVRDVGNPKVASTLARSPEGLRLEARTGDEVRRALVAYAVGSGDRGLTPVGRDEHGQLRELRLSRYGDIDGWDVTTGHPDLPTGAGGLESFLGEAMTRDDERRCLGCHTTDFRAARDRVGAASHDRGIGCERCHGPGGNHVKAIALKFPEPAIARPRLARPERVVALCGQCHSPRGLRVVHPTDRDAVRFQAVTLTWSRCYTETGKGLSCTTCHSPHHDADTAPAHYEPKCLTCHGSEGPERLAASGARRVPCPVNPQTNCLECHMPASKSTMRHTTFTDHHIRLHGKANVQE